MSNELVKIVIDTEEERFPCLVIGKFNRGSSPGSDLEIPATMFDRLTAAKRIVEDIEREIAEYVLARYPERGDIREWLADDGRP